MPEKEKDFSKIEFIKYLDSCKLSSKSLKNYKSDLNHFLGWAILKIRTLGSYVESLTDIIPFLSVNLCHEYKNYMTKNASTPKTINRRLSTLRHLAKFLLITQVVDLDFMGEVENIALNQNKTKTAMPLIEDFKKHLEAEKVSPNTIKSYLSDIKQFMSWLETNNQQSTINN